MNNAKKMHRDSYNIFENNNIANNLTNMHNELKMKVSKLQPNPPANPHANPPANPPANPQSLQFPSGPEDNDGIPLINNNKLNNILSTILDHSDLTDKLYEIINRIKQTNIPHNLPSTSYMSRDISLTNNINILNQTNSHIIDTSNTYSTAGDISNTYFTAQDISNTYFTAQDISNTYSGYRTLKQAFNIKKDRWNKLINENNIKNKNDAINSIKTTIQESLDILKHDSNLEYTSENIRYIISIIKDIQNNTSEESSFIQDDNNEILSYAFYGIIRQYIYDLLILNKKYTSKYITNIETYIEDTLLITNDIKNKIIQRLTCKSSCVYVPEFYLVEPIKNLQEYPIQLNKQIRLKIYMGDRKAT